MVSNTGRGSVATNSNAVIVMERSPGKDLGKASGGFGGVVAGGDEKENIYNLGKAGTSFEN